MIRDKYNQILKTIKGVSPIIYYDSVQLSDMAMNSRLKNKFNICNSYDLFEPNDSKPYSILNTDDSTKDGTHWVGVIQNNNTIYVYDSFARNGSRLMRPFIKSMNKQGYIVRFINKGSDQPEKAVDCGIRCLLYLIFVDRYGIEKCIEI